MRFGVGIPTGAEGMYVPSRFADPKEIIEATKLSERLGFYSVWGADFFTLSPAMGIEDKNPPQFYEVLVALAYLSSITTHIKLGAGTITLPLRDPVLLAKQAATLDVFSNGRLLLAVGLGAYRDQFEMVRPREAKAHRATMMLESLEALHLLLAEDQVSFNGKYYEFRDVSLNPKPVQQPPSIYLSGRSPDTPQRVARWGSGWLLSRVQDDSVRERIESLLPSLEEMGRDISSVDIVVTKFVSVARTHEEAVKRFNSSMLPHRTRLMSQKRGGVGPISVERAHARDLIGTPEEICEKVDRLKDDGVTHCVALHFAADTFDEMLEQAQLFGEEVLPRFQSS